MFVIPSFCVGKWIDEIGQHRGFMDRDLCNCILNALMVCCLGFQSNGKKRLVLMNKKDLCCKVPKMHTINKFVRKTLFLETFVLAWCQIKRFYLTYHARKTNSLWLIENYVERSLAIKGRILNYQKFFISVFCSREKQ